MTINHTELTRLGLVVKAYIDRAIHKLGTDIAILQFRILSAAVNGCNRDHFAVHQVAVTTQFMKVIHHGGFHLIGHGGVAFWRPQVIHLLD